MKDAFTVKCDELIQDNINTLVSGRITDFAGYKQVVGRLQGINEAREKYIELISSYDEDK